MHGHTDHSAAETHDAAVEPAYVRSTDGVRVASYDFGGDGNRTMTLVYNLRSPRDVYRRFAGVQGSAYLVGGVSVQFLKGDDITLAPIRTGVGLRLGANIGYLKYTRRPTWNPF